MSATDLQALVFLGHNWTPAQIDAMTPEQVQMLLLLPPPPRSRGGGR